MGPFALYGDCQHSNLHPIDDLYRDPELRDDGDGGTFAVPRRALDSSRQHAETFAKQLGSESLPADL